MTGRALRLLDLSGHLLQFVPGLGWVVIAVFFQEVGPVIQEAGVRVEGDRDEFPVDRIVLDDGREELLQILFGKVRLEV